MKSLLKKSVTGGISIIAALSATSAMAAPYATDWVKGYNSKTRLIIGGAPSADGKIQRYAGLEIAMPKGWKTYWRQPGSAGGIPPHVVWQGSSNLKSAKLRYPAPIRMVDPSGISIGYKKNVVFPIEIAPLDTAKPVVLSVHAFFGVCREICIPAEAKFKVTLTPDLFRQTPPELAGALRRLPVADGKKSMPKLGSVTKSKAANGKHALTFDVRFPGGATGADLFAETGDLVSLPMAKVVASPSPDMVRYKVMIDDAAQWQSLAKKGLLITMVSEAGASEARVPRP